MEWWWVVNVVMTMGPALVGLALVRRHTGRGRWRTWALLGFGLGVASGIAQLAITALVVGTVDQGGGLMQALLGPVSLGLMAMSLAGSGFVVAAVLSDRPHDPATDAADPPVDDDALEDDVLEDDPLAYDPASFEPPRHMSGCRWCAAG